MYNYRCTRCGTGTIDAGTCNACFEASRRGTPVADAVEHSLNRGEPVGPGTFELERTLTLGKTTPPVSVSDTELATEFLADNGFDDDGSLKARWERQNLAELLSSVRRAAVDEMASECNRLVKAGRDAMRAESEARITELQASGTRLEDERRKYKALHGASKKMLTALLVDEAISNRLAGSETPEMVDKIRSTHNLFREVNARISLLENDAWCGAAGLAREFVKDVVANLGALDLPRNAENNDGGFPMSALLFKWARRFDAALNR